MTWPCWWRRRVANGKGIVARQFLKEAGGKSVGRRTGMPRTEKVEGRQMRRGNPG